MKAPTNPNSTMSPEKSNCTADLPVGIYFVKKILNPK